VERVLYNKCKELGISVLQVNSILTKAGYIVPQRTLQSWFDKDFDNCSNDKIRIAVRMIIRNHGELVNKVSKVLFQESN
jgi:hypothetical protein